MSTVIETRPQSKPKAKARAKPARFVRLLLAPFENNPGVVRLTVGKDAADYLLQPLASDFGHAFRVLKQGGEEEYDVLLAPDGHGSCECAGWLRWQRCKHHDGLQALKVRGLI